MKVKKIKETISLRFVTLPILWVFLLLANNIHAGDFIGEYTAQWSNDSAEIKVTGCFKTLPNKLVSGDRLSHNHIKWAKIDGAPLRVARNKIWLPGAGSGCVEYLVDVNQAVTSRAPHKPDSVWILNTQSWLWLPDKNLVRLRFSDFQGNTINVAAPWKKQDDFYVVGNTPVDWTSRTVFGDFEQVEYPIGEDILSVTLVGNVRNRKDEILLWLAENSHATQTLFGEAPLKKSQVLVAPLGPKGGPVPWGEVQRGGYPTVHFFIDETRPIKQFMADWTASHELSHLFLPKIHWRDRWMSEGIASYYQNVLRARSGMLSQETAWQKLKQGFTRGRKAQDHRPLRNARKVMHLYWGGVGFYFLADLRLREQGKSLDQTMKRFKDCCLPSEQSWTAEELTTKLDELSQTSIFTSLLEKEATESRFPISENMEAASHPLIKKHLKSILQPKEYTF